MKTAYLAAFVTHRGQSVWGMEKHKNLSGSVPIVLNVSKKWWVYPKQIITNISYMYSTGHCPSNDDPLTLRVETDCFNTTAKDSIHRGESGNLCQVDCSNRGICDHKSGNMINVLKSKMKSERDLQFLSYNYFLSTPPSPPSSNYPFLAFLINYSVLDSVFFTGICDCFDGFFGNDCNTQDNNAVYMRWDASQTDTS